MNIKMSSHLFSYLLPKIFITKSVILKIKFLSPYYISPDENLKLIVTCCKTMDGMGILIPETVAFSQLFKLKSKNAGKGGS